MTKAQVIVFFILSIGILLRVLWLGKYPTGFFRDEAALGYNAYSIWLTGKDEFGLRLPTVFRSFEVFFLPLYVYLTAIVTGFFGLSEASTRLVSSISGIFSLIIIYLTASKIWNKKVGILSLLVLAIAPWHIFYSRGAFEGNLALTLFSGGFYFWIKFKDSKMTIHFLISLVLFSLSMYSYQAERLVVPLFLLASSAVWAKGLLTISRRLVIPSIMILIFLSPLISLTFKPGGYHRSLGVSIFSEEPPGYLADSEISLIHKNKVYLRTRQFASLYLSYFSPRNLFLKADDNKQRSVENFSVFYPFMAPMLFLGLLNLLKKRSRNKIDLAFWVFLAPVPAALTSDPFHTYRSLLLYTPLAICVGFGIYSLILAFTSDFYKKAFLCGLILLSFVNLYLFAFDYFVLTSTLRAREWDYGYKEIVKVAVAESSQKIIVDDPWTEPYIHFLFFGKVNPIIYQESVQNLGNPLDYYYNTGDEIRPLGFGKIEFRKIDWPAERGNSGVVFVFFAELLPKSEYESDPNVQLVKEIKYPDGTAAYRIVKIK